MKIISRDWIREDAEFYSFSSGEEKYTKERLCIVIDYWKENLLKNGAEPGRKIGIAVIPMHIIYTGLLFAIFELGLKLVVLNRPNTEEECKTPKNNAHLPLDIYVSFKVNEYSSITHIAEKHFIKNSKKHIIIDYEDWNTVSQIYIPKENYSKILAKPEDEILLCNSSGTISDPKLIHHTHKFLYNLCQYNWDKLDLNREDVALHLSSINHGATLSAFYLPSLFVCKKHHFHLPLDISNRAGDYYGMLYRSCKKYGITKLLSPNGRITDSLIEEIEQSEEGLPETTIIVVSFINPKWLKVIKTGKLKKIISVFGCSETGGPLFVPFIDKDTNEETFDPKYMGHPTVGFYDTTQTNGLLKVYLKDYNKTIITEDIVRVEKDGYWFVSKNKLRKINDQDVNPIQIVEAIEHIGSRTKFEVVVDEIYNELYIVTDDKNLIDNKEEVKRIVCSLYQGNIKLTDILYMENFDQVIVAVKPDRDKLLEFINKVCRGR